MTDRLSLAVFTGLPLVGGMQRWVFHTLHELCETLPPPPPSPPRRPPSPPPPETKKNPRLLKNEDPFQEMIPREKHKYRKLPLISVF